MEQVFSRAGQLSEVNLDPDALADMVFIMVNKHAYKPSLKDIMDKYYEMFRGKNQSESNKKLFQHKQASLGVQCSPDSPDHSDQGGVAKNRWKEN